MKTFIISTTYTGCMEYIVHANSKDEAQELFEDNVFVKATNRDTRVDNNEEVFEVEEVI